MSTSQVRILQIAGPAGVGKTTLGWEISVQLRRAGVSHVVLDSDELDRVWPLSKSERDSLNRANLSAFWANVSALDQSRLILVGVFLRPGADGNWIARAAALRCHSYGAGGIRCRARKATKDPRDRLWIRRPAQAHIGPGSPIPRSSTRRR